MTSAGASTAEALPLSSGSSSVNGLAVAASAPRGSGAGRGQSGAVDGALGRKEKALRLGFVSGAAGSVGFLLLRWCPAAAAPCLAGLTPASRRWGCC